MRIEFVLVAYILQNSFAFYIQPLKLKAQKNINIRQ